MPKILLIKFNSSSQINSIKKNINKCPVLIPLGVEGTQALMRGCRNCRLNFLPLPFNGSSTYEGYLLKFLLYFMPPILGDTCSISPSSPKG